MSGRRRGRPAPITVGYDDDDDAAKEQEEGLKRVEHLHAITHTNCEYSLVIQYRTRRE